MALRLEALSLEELQELLFDLDDIRHDLGKYIGFETRFVGADAPEAQRRAALQRDLLATRSAGGQSESAWALWARVRPDQLDGDPDVVLIDQVMATLGGLDLDTCDLDRAVALAGQVSQATRRLYQRAQDRG